ncbi:P-selectin glycoprotein ligand 1 [Ctenodactylus gundi]
MLTTYTRQSGYNFCHDPIVTFRSLLNETNCVWHFNGLGTMAWPLLLLLALLGPASAWDDGPQGASSPAHARERRQVTHDLDFEEEDYFSEPTNTPGILREDTSVATELATQWAPSTVDLVTKVVSVSVHATQAPFTEGTLSTEPTVRKASSTQPATAEAETSQSTAVEPAAAKVETLTPAAGDGETSQLATTEAETLQPAPTETETSQPAPTVAETSQPAATEAPSTKPTATEALSTEPTITQLSTTEPAPTSTFWEHPVTLKGVTMAASNLPDLSMKKGQAVTAWSPSAPSPPAPSGSIPVRQCLLAILILALLATIFLVCTVVLAVRLSRKGHMYPVRGYSPTEMVCISALLPDGGEGASATTNGGLAKSPGLKAEPGEDREEDNLTLHSFLP